MYLFTDDGSDDIDTLELPNLAEKAPRVFLDVVIPILSKSVQIALERGPYSNGIPVLYETSAKRGPAALFALCRNAFQRVAADSPKDAEVCLDQFDHKLHKVMLHLHLETIGANPTALGHRFEALLDDSRLFEAGFIGAEWKSFADTARSVVKAKCLSVQTIEERVSHHRPEQDLACSGFIEWCVLTTIGRDLLSTQGKRRLSELECKFPDEQLPTPQSFDGGFVESPIPPAACRKMNDDHWLYAIRNDRYQNDSPQLRRGEIVGGALELARELEALAKSDPDRFARFFLRLPEDSNSIFGQHLLQGLAGAVHVDEEATIETLRTAHSHRDRPFGLQIVRLIERHHASARDDEVFEAVLWYASHGSVEDRGVSFPEIRLGEFPSINGLVHANNELENRGVNSTRGYAWRTLGQLVTHHPHRAPDTWCVVEQRASEETSAPVRTMMLQTLTSLYRLDRARFGACLQRLVEPVTGERDDASALAPLATRIGIHLFSYIERDLPDVALDIIARMIGSSERRLHLVGTWWALCERLRRGNTADRFAKIEHESPAHTKLWVSILSEFAADTEFREMAISELGRLFQHDIPEVRKAASEVFRRIPKDEFRHFEDLARTFIRSPAFEDATSQVIRSLEETSHDVTELVLEVGETALEDRKHHRVIYDIQKLLKREYVNSESRPPLRKRFLDVIDEMAARNITGADDLMQLDDRLLGTV